MAKKKKNKGSGGGSETKADAKADAPPSAAAAIAAPVVATGNKVVDAAYRSGNYAAIRHFAQNMPEAKKLLELTKVDVGQAIVGLIALIVVLAVAIGTLH